MAFTDCPGTASEKAGKAASCQGCPNQEACALGPNIVDPDLATIEERMKSVRHKILVLSGKGGVGKSTFASQLAFALAQTSRSVSLHQKDQSVDSTARPAASLSWITIALQPKKSDCVSELSCNKSICECL